MECIGMNFSGRGEGAFWSIFFKNCMEMKKNWPIGNRIPEAPTIISDKEEGQSSVLWKYCQVILKLLFLMLASKVRNDINAN